MLLYELPRNILRSNDWQIKQGHTLIVKNAPVSGRKVILIGLRVFEFICYCILATVNATFPLFVRDYQIHLRMMRKIIADAGKHVLSVLSTIVVFLKVCGKKSLNEIGFLCSFLPLVATKSGEIEVVRNLKFTFRMLLI